MENEATLTTTTNTNTNTNNVNLPSKSKKKSALNIIRVALYMIRRRSNGKNDSAHVEVASKGLWKKVVDAVHPLHHHHHHLPTNRKPPPAIDMDHKIIGKDFGYVDSYPNRSPNYLASPASSSSSSATPSQYASALNLQELDKNDHPSSRYASALNLQELDKNGECENSEIVIENGNSDEKGDDMIDEKAEEFIANFYEQMRLQRIRSANGYKK